MTENEKDGVWIVFGRDVFGFPYAHMVFNDQYAALVYAEDVTDRSGHVAPKGFEVVFVPFATSIDYDGERGGVCVREILGGDPDDLRNAEIRERQKSVTT